MKRILSALLALVLLLTACGSAGSEPTETAIPTEIPILETEPVETEPEEVPVQETLPPPEPEDDAMVRVLDYLPGCRQFLPYASVDNFTKTVIYDFYDAYLRYGTVKKLMQVSEELQQQGYYLMIWDGFRPVYAQKILWEVYPDARYVANPETGFSAHSQGNTVDLTLMDSNGILLEMPTEFDDFTAKADRSYYDCTPEAAANAQLLEDTMEKYGFTGFFNEWWHFSDKEYYPVEEEFQPVKTQWYAATEATALRLAPEGETFGEIPAEKTFLVLAQMGDSWLVDYRGLRGYVVKDAAEPVELTGAGFPEIWEANCNDYISLRTRPNIGAPTLGHIPNGGTFELLDWDRKFAKVRCQGQEGYVLSQYILPQDVTWSSQILDIVPLTDSYSYERMLRDVDAIAKKYPDLVQKDSIGLSELGREIPVLRIGNENAKHQVLLQGAIHGREHMTAWLLMAMVDYWLDNGMEALVKDTCYHIIPMVNPDGVVLSQTGVLPEAALQVYYDDLALGYAGTDLERYTALWKANGLGVDLNRNFPALWEGISNPRKGPSAEMFQGYEPFSAAESRALRDYTLARKWDATISYHSSGSLILSEFGVKESVNAQSRSLAQALAAVSGYTVASSIGLTGGGYKDWAMESLDIPSVTFEIGCDGEVLEHKELYSTFSRNCGVLWAVDQWLQGR